MALIDLKKELGDAPVAGPHYLILLVAGLAIIFDGYDDLVIAFSLRSIAAEWGLSPTQAGGLLSVGLAGLTIGAAIGGALADRLGRLPVMVWSLVISGLGSIAIAAYVGSLSEFLVMRFIVGLGLGVLLPLISVYLNELAPSQLKNVVVGIVVVGFSVGGILASVGAIFVIPQYGWRILFWIGGAGIPIGLLCWLILPESPLFLASVRKVDQLRAVMSRLLPQNQTLYASGDFLVAEQVKGMPVVQLFAPAFWRNTVLIWIAAFLLVFATRSMTGWLPSVMVSRGESFTQSSAFAGVLLGMTAIGALIIATIADRNKQPRATLVVSMVIGAISIAALAAFNLHWTNLTFMALGGFFVIGCHAVFYALTASLYDTPVRSTGVGFMLGVGRLGGVVGPLAAGAVQQIYPGFTAYFVMMAVAVAVSAIFVGSIKPPAN